MALFWWMLWGLCWVAAGQLLWDQLGAAAGAGLTAFLMLLQVFFVDSLSGSRPTTRSGERTEWLGVVSAGLVGGTVGMLAVRSVLFFRGSWELPLTALGWLLGMLVLGAVYILAMWRGEEKGREDTLSGLLVAIFVISLTSFLLAKFSLATTAPDWLFRFPSNAEVRELWNRTEWVSFLLLLWALGAGCVVKLVKGSRVRREAF